MDKAIRAILSIAIALIFPMVVFFGVVTAIPSKHTTASYPNYPSCSTSRYDSYTRSYTSDYSCQNQFDDYYAATNRYDNIKKTDQDRSIVRGQAALIIAVLTAIFVFFIRDVKEVAAGLTAGSILTIIGAVSVIMTDYTNSGDENTKVTNSLLTIVAFIALVALMYVFEKTTIKRGPMIYAEPGTGTPTQHKHAHHTSLPPKSTHTEKDTEIDQPIYPDEPQV